MDLSTIEPAKTIGWRLARLSAVALVLIAVVLLSSSLIHAGQTGPSLVSTR